MSAQSADLVHHYSPRGSAVEVLNSREDEILMSGPAGTGKSRACLEKLLLQSLRYPRMRGVIIRKTQASLASTALKTWREHVAVEAIGNRTLWFYGGSAAEPPQYRFANGSIILVVGMDKPSRIMSSEFDVAYVQEATELNPTDWEFVTTRLRNGRMPYQQLIADCNPDTPTHWLKTRCDEGTTQIIYCRHEDNPLLYDEHDVLTRAGEAYMGKLDRLTGVRYLRLRKGLWAAAEGLVYDEFSPDVHILNRFPIPRDWPRFWSIDFGYTNPFCLQCWAQDSDGRIYLYREIYHTQRTVDRHARDILKIVAPGGVWTEPHPYAIVADPADAESRARFEIEAGLGTIAADKAVKDGIEIAQRRFRIADDGKPRIYFLRDSVVERDASLEEAGRPCSTLEELPGYIWLPAKDGKAAKEEPTKNNDHGCDGMRYVCKYLDPGRRPGIRIIR